MCMVRSRFTTVELVKWLWLLMAALWLMCEACSSIDGLLLCRYCGHEVALDEHIHFLPSPFALSLRNDTVTGTRKTTAQLFENPQGFQFAVITLKQADVLKHWPAEKHSTWFPGFSWMLATCPRCKTHLGWAFQPSDWSLTVTRQDFEDSEQTFVALIIQKLLHAQFTSTLVTPNSFRS
ncbi:uncharacterized protein si:ch211-51h9.7 [Hoplias malabaricus]|uniref:uncharacterized protein si:ch211-51h9.7 n=1 Tax=Hoplias malabaricus TaxID=27720 RepID=UPI003461FB39